MNSKQRYIIYIAVVLMAISICSSKVIAPVDPKLLPQKSFEQQIKEQNHFYMMRFGIYIPIAILAVSGFLIYVLRTRKLSAGTGACGFVSEDTYFLD